MFYENFISKIDSIEVKEKSLYKYSMNIRKKILWSASGVSMFIIAAYSFYVFSQNKSVFVFLMGAVLALMAFTVVKSMFSYKLEVDRENRKLNLKNNEIKIDDIESAVLKMMVPPGKKYLEPCIDIIFLSDAEKNEKVRVIVPLIMGKKGEFVKLMKLMVGAKFSVEKI